MHVRLALDRLFYTTDTTYPAKTHKAADAICVRLLDKYSTRVTICLLQFGHWAPVGPGPNFCGPSTVVRGRAVGAVGAVGATGDVANPGGGGGVSPKYDGGGGLADGASYGGGRPILFSTKIRLVNFNEFNFKIFFYIKSTSDHVGNIDHRFQRRK